MFFHPLKTECKRSLFCFCHTYTQFYSRRYDDVEVHSSQVSKPMDSVCLYCTFHYYNKLNKNNSTAPSSCALACAYFILTIRWCFSIHSSLHTLYTSCTFCHTTIRFFISSFYLFQRTVLTLTFPLEIAINVSFSLFPFMFLFIYLSIFIHTVFDTYNYLCTDYPLWMHAACSYQRRRWRWRYRVRTHLHTNKLYTFL